MCTYDFNSPNTTNKLIKQQKYKIELNIYFYAPSKGGQMPWFVLFLWDAGQNKILTQSITSTIKRATPVRTEEKI